MDEATKLDPPTEEIQALIRELRDVEDRLHVLAGDGVDAVLDVDSGFPILLQQAQRQLRISKARLELMLEHLPAVVWTADANLQVTSLSGAGVARMGEDEQIVGQHLSELSEALAIEGLVRAHRRALEGEASRFELEREESVFDCWVSPNRDAAGQLIGSVGLAVDVTERFTRERLLQELSEELESRVRERTAQLSEAYEELQVTEEEIRQQNEELRATRKSLEVERQRYQELFELAPDGYLVTSGEGLIEEANRAACELLGVRRDFLVGKPLSVYVASDDRPAFYRWMDRMAVAGEDRGREEAEILLHPRDGDPVEAAVSVTGVLGEDGKSVKLRWLVRDISETRRLMKENRRQRQFLERLMDVVPVGIAVVRGEDHRFARANARYRSIPGARQPVVGRRFEEVFPAVPDAAGTELLDAVCRTGRGVTLHARRGAFVQGEGQSYWDIDVAPLQSADGVVDGALMVVHDVSREVRARKETTRLAADLARERDTLRTIMETTHALLAYLDPDFRFVRVNTAYAEGAGYRKEDLIGRAHFDLFPDPENEEVFRRVRDTRAPVFFDAKPFVYPDQPERGITYWDWSLIPVKDSDGVVRGLVLSLLDVTERERLLEQLARERARLQAIIQNAPEGIVVADEEARIVLTNPAADRMYARSVPYGEDYESHSELCLCRSDGTAIPPRELPLTRSALDGETLHDVELVLVRPEGEWRHLLVDTAPIRDREGRISGAIGVFSDVTERVRTEARVRRYAEQLRVLHEIDVEILAARSAGEIADASLRGLRELVPSAVSRVVLVGAEDGDARVLASSSAEEQGSCEPDWCSLSWDRAADVLAEGRPFVVEDRDHAPEPALAEVMEAEGVRSMTCVPLTVGGTLLGCLRVGRRTAGPLSEEELGIVAAVADQAAIGIHQAELQDRLARHAEGLEHRVAVRTAQLRASEARFRAIFEQSVLGIALLDQRGRVMAANAALCEMLGRTSEGIAGQLFARFAHPDEEIAAALQGFRAMVNGERDKQRLETRYLGTDESERWVNLVVSPVLNPEGEAQFFIAMGEDVTERKRAQDALVQSEKLATTGRLAAALAHEINNPLQSVLGCLGLAMESLNDGDDQDLDQYLRIALEELRRAAGIVSRLRDVSRPVDQGQAEPVDLNELIDDLLVLTGKQLKDAGIQLVRRTPEGLPRPAVVPDRVKQVLLNLALNAMEAMSEGGTLELVTNYDHRRREVCLTVTDSGPGIPEEVLIQLFTPFFSTKDDGLGLGLFVSQYIVQECGGRLEVESEMGKGSTFRVRLPV